MTATDYIKEKNKIIEKYTGITLVPEDQIEEVDQGPLSMASDMNACPYCLLWFGTPNHCNGCPMFKAGNCCSDDDSTYHQVTDALCPDGIVGNKEIKGELSLLIERYNEELEQNNIATD